MDNRPRDAQGRWCAGSAPAVEGGHSEPEPVDPPEELLRVLRSAARLQQVVPDAVLVGGSVAAVYAGHRLSFDHDHVLADLNDRYEAVLDAVEATDGWATSVRASKPPMTIMGDLGGVEAGLRQLRRRVPLQTHEIRLPTGEEVVVPTREDALRVKAYLVEQRNQVRDYLDVAAMSDRFGADWSADVLAGMDEFYRDRSDDPESVSTQVVARLAHPSPRDTRTLDDLARYKGLQPRWQDWAEVTRVCADLAQRILREG